MPSIKNFCLFIGFFTFFSSSSFCQVNIGCPGENKTIFKFTADSTTSFDNQFVKDSLINNIKSSTNSIEIRIYDKSISNHGSILVLEKNDNTAFIKEIDFFYLQSRGRKQQGFKEIRNKYSSIYYRILTRPLRSEFCKIIDTLIKNNIFTISDEKKSLQKNSIKAPINTVMDDKGSYLYEIKCGVSYRNFTYSMGLSTYINPEDLNNIKIITQTFYNEKPKN